MHMFIVEKNRLSFLNDQVPEEQDAQAEFEGKGTLSPSNG